MERRRGWGFDTASTTCQARLWVVEEVAVEFAVRLVHEAPIGPRIESRRPYWLSEGKVSTNFHVLASHLKSLGISPLVNATALLCVIVEYLFFL